MNDELQTLSKLFNERLFRIPDYQRGYAWTEKQLEDFWSDLNQIEDGRNHYTGVLTLETVPKDLAKKWEEDQWIIESKNFSPFYVVDGQQRLTTSIILVSCIAATLSSPDDELNYTSKRDIEQRYLFQSKHGGASRSYIFGYERDNPSYEYLKTEIFGEKSASSRHEETAYTNNLKFAQEYFISKLSKLSRLEIEVLFTKITQRLLFNVFSISEEVDVCVAFETMNNRGKALSHLELLKNRLIYLTTRIRTPSSEAGDLRRTINESWKTVYYNLGRNKSAPLNDDFFLRSHHFLYFIEPTPERSEEHDQRKHERRLMEAVEKPLYRGLLNDIFTFDSVLHERDTSNGSDDRTIEKIYKYSVSLQDSVKVWFHIFNPEQTNDASNFNFWLAKINRIGADEIYPVVLAIMLATKDNDERTGALASVERVLFLDLLAPSRYYRYRISKLQLLNIALRISRGDAAVSEITKYVTSYIKDNFESDEGMKELREALKSKNFYFWRATLYLLYEYNLSLQVSSKTDREKIDWDLFVEHDADYRSIEHIYPQSARAKYWSDRFKSLSNSNREILRNSIGNLLPLSKPKNASLSNKPFPEKVSGGVGVVGYSYGSYAENEVSTLYNEWTPQTILDRSLRILDFIEERWGLNFGKDAEKITMLGLGFVRPSARINTQKKPIVSASSKGGKNPRG